ncbi:MAG: flagellar biosynthesis protein FlhF [SAR324 cluster bacterium]|nr:flagellar biosynthesis protein FlhF [SAR324 cluster bacterium]
MQIKRYRAADMHEALSKVKKDMGADAVILSTRHVRGGGGTFGLFGKPMLEVTAARETPGDDGGNSTLRAALTGGDRALAVNEGEHRPADGAASELMRQMLSRNKMETESLLAPLQDDIHDLKEIMQSVGDSQKNGLREETALQQIRSDLANMHQLLHSLTAQSTTLRGAEYPDNLVVLYQQLIFNGMEEKFARRLVEESLKSIPGKEMEDFSYVKIFLARMLMKIINTTNGIQADGDQQKVVALVGPTGVGKTTTVAKLASEQLLKHRRKVALITIDTFRIAAVEQLKVYAKIMGVPVSVVQSKGELRQAIDRNAGADVIFVDTGGRSQRDDLQMSEIYKLFGDAENIDILLTLSATTKDADLTEITRRFNEIPLSGVVFTKLDESTAFGSMFNHAIRFKMPIAYLTTGQKVPEDMELATRERLVDLMLNITDA